VHTMLDLLAQTAIDLYEDPESDRAYRRTLASWPGLKEQMLLSFQNGKVNGHDLRGRATVAAARRAPASEKRGLWRAAEKDAAMLRRQLQPPGAPIAATVQAAVHFQRGDVEAAVRGLREAARGFDAAHMALHANAVRRRLGVILGGDEGRALVDAAEARMREQAIVEPARMSALLAPGFGPP